MYRLLLVDDEKEIVDWLYELFQETPNLELDVYKALSGFEALDILGRTKIDVVISDIKMPGLNGLQLLERIRNWWPMCRVVFLTGYNEFEYVYTAIKYEGVSYLLKTEEDSEIVKEVRKAISELERNTQNRELMDKVRQYMERALPSIQRDVFKQLILDPEAGQATTQEMLDELQLPLWRNRPVYLAAGRFDRFPANATPAFGARMAVSLKLRAEELLGGNFTHVNLIHQGNIDLIWLLQPTGGTTPEGEDCDKTYVPLLGGALEALQDFSREALGLTISFVFCSKSAQWEEIESSYATISRLLNASSGMGGELLLNDRNFTGLLSRPEARRGGELLVTGRILSGLKSLPALLERGDMEGFMQSLSGVLECLRDTGNRSDSSAEELYYTAATILLSHINRRSLMEKLSTRVDVSRLMRAEVHENWGSAVDYLYAVSKAIFDLQKGVQEKNIRESIDRIKQYIKEHLGEDISLVRLAEMSYFNPSYLSRLFKQATGQNITDFISGLRIERAKALLADHGRKINDISVALGYESQHYFSRFFKKYTGLTPQEYRESIMKM